MAERIALGWRFGEKRNKDEKRHPNILPWDKLDEKPQEIDRRMVRAWTQALNQAKMELLLRP